MKKIIILGTIILTLFLTGCGKKEMDDIVGDLEKKISNLTTYQIEGDLQITNNDDTYNYDVLISHEKPNKYRVSLTNIANEHEQIILKNDEGVYVITHQSTQL